LPLYVHSIFGYLGFHWPVRPYVKYRPSQPMVGRVIEMLWFPRENILFVLEFDEITIIVVIYAQHGID
jgi:hypothetical protein